MKSLLWVPKILLFLIVLTFAIKNTDMVTVRYYLGMEWQAPLIFVMLATFALGVAAGVMAGLSHVFRVKRELAKCKKDMDRIANPAKQDVVDNLPNVI